MAKYNLYKLRDGKLAELEAKLAVLGYVLSGSLEDASYTTNAYFTDSPHETSIWWLDQYRNVFDDYQHRRNLVYSGCIIASNSLTGRSFVIPLGKTHFYIQEFIEYSFGLEMAERIGNRTATKSKSSKHFGGQTSKSITSFVDDSVLNFAPGEATDYVKLKAANNDIWGKAFIHFGTSMQIGSIDKGLDRIGDLLNDVEQAYASDSGFELPRMIKINDATQISERDTALASAILNRDASVGLVDYLLFGVDIVFSQQTHTQLQFEDEWSDRTTDLTIDNVINFANSLDTPLADALRDIKVKMFVNDTSRFTAPLIDMIDYVGDEDTFLYQGRWYVFSESYLETLKTTVSQISVEAFPISFSSQEYRAWKDTLDPEVKVNYRERYVINKIIQNNPGSLDFDRAMDFRMLNGKKTTIEVGDIYDPQKKELNVVKIGDAKDFGYAFDQAVRTLAMVQNRKYITLTGDRYDVSTLRLTLVTENVTVPASPLDVNSLSFWIKLAELQSLANEKRLSIILSFARYERNGAQ